MTQPDEISRLAIDELAACDLRNAGTAQLRAVWFRLEEAIATWDIGDRFMVLLQAEQAVRDELQRRDSRIILGDGP